MADERPTFMIEDAKIIYRNFEGREGPFNPVGVRSFAVILPEDIALKMAEDGWNVRRTKPRDDEEIPSSVPFVSVAVSYKMRPPRVVMMTSKSRTSLTEETIAVLDWADIQTADVICNGSEWGNAQKGGIKAYCKSLFVTVREDYLEQKYGINEQEG